MAPVGPVWSIAQEQASDGSWAQGNRAILVLLIGAIGDAGMDFGRLLQKRERGHKAKARAYFYGMLFPCVFPIVLILLLMSLAALEAVRLVGKGYYVDSSACVFMALFFGLFAYMSWRSCPIKVTVSGDLVTLGTFGCGSRTLKCSELEGYGHGSGMTVEFMFKHRGSAFEGFLSIPIFYKGGSDIVRHLLESSSK